MLFSLSLVAAATSLLLTHASAEGLYHKQSPVLQVNANNYRRLIEQSNHTSIVEFYAPWCGHCKNLHPAYEKAARGLAGLAKVAAVNCDEESNKSFCGAQGVKGFPTLKIVKPGKKYGKPIVEDYNGPREAKGIIEAVTAKIPNHVRKATEEELAAIAAEEGPKAVLLTEKGTTSALMKALSVDFLGTVGVVQVKSKDKVVIGKFIINKFPTFVLLPGGGAQAIVYEGELKKPAMIQFLAQIAEPNPDPAPAKVKMPKEKTKSDKAAKKAKAEFESASSSHAKSEAPEQTPAAADETVVTDTKPAGESPEPAITPTAKPIDLSGSISLLPTLETSEELATACFAPNSGICILAFLSEKPTDNSTAALAAMSEVVHKYKSLNRAIFPFYAVPASNLDNARIKQELGLFRELEIVATSRKRNWWRRFDPFLNGAYTTANMEGWVDKVRMNEGEKHKLPEAMLQAISSLGPGQTVPPLTEKTESAKETISATETPMAKETTAAKEAEPETTPDASTDSVAPSETETIVTHETVTQQIKKSTAAATEEAAEPVAEATPTPEGTAAAEKTAEPVVPVRSEEEHDEL